METHAVDEAIVVEVKRFWDENLRSYLTEAHGTELKQLLNVYEQFQSGEITPDDLIFESKTVLDRTWEMLNVGKWMNVPVEVKQAYAIASFVQIIGLLHSKEPNSIEKALEVTDMGILLGFPIRSISLTQIADILSRHVTQESSALGDEGTAQYSASQETSRGQHGDECLLESENPVEEIHRPSLEHFYRDYFRQRLPVKLTGCMDNWPALGLWTDFGYLVKKAGSRTVPIELGKNYADDEYSQKLMKISDFVNDFMRGGDGPIGYLAQHQLFDQVPELRRDIIEPDYCALSENAEVQAETEVNAWFGPAGTVSPLHFDPKFNLLCQVVGTKKIILHPPSDTPYLYPHEGSLLFNTSRVDVEKPDLETFPEYKKAVRTECLLRPGEMLFIPPKHWHYVRSLENSFSVSFWWK